MNRGDFDFPSNNVLVDLADGSASIVWTQWFQRIHQLAVSLQQSGTTATRPTKVLWIGRRYYDTTLGKPVYLAAINPTVWKDATGAPC